MKMIARPSSVVLIIAAFLQSGCKRSGEYTRTAADETPAAEDAAAADDDCTSPDASALPCLDIAELAEALTPETVAGTDPAPPIPSDTLDGDKATSASSFALAGAGNNQEAINKLSGIGSAAIVSALYQVSLRSFLYLDKIVESMPGDTAQQKVYGFETFILNTEDRLASGLLLLPIDPEWVNQIQLSTKDLLERLRALLRWIPGNTYDQQKQSIATFYNGFGGRNSGLKDKFFTAKALLDHALRYAPSGSSSAPQATSLLSFGNTNAALIRSTYQYLQLISVDGRLDARSFNMFFTNLNINDFDQTLMALVDQLAFQGKLNPAVAQVAKALYANNQNGNIRAMILENARTAGAGVFGSLLQDLGVENYKVPVSHLTRNGAIKVSTLVRLAAKVIQPASANPAKTVVASLPPLDRMGSGPKRLPIPAVLTRVQFLRGLPVAKLKPLIMDSQFPVELVIIGAPNGYIQIE